MTSDVFFMDARSDSADYGTVFGNNLCAFASRGAPLGQDAYALACNPVANLFLNDAIARETTFLSPTFLDGPDQPRLYRRGTDIDVMTVQA